MMLRPFISFYGGKWRAAPLYPAPKHQAIIEPFAGAAGYSTRHHMHNIILVEKDPTIAAMWRWLIAASPADVLALPDLPAGSKVADLCLDVGPAALIGFWLNKGCARPMQSPSAWMRKSVSGLLPRCPPSSFWGSHIRQRVAEQVPRIKHWQIIEGDYTAAPDVEACWFIDPPYQQAGRHYRCSSKAIDFDALGAWCRQRQGQVMVCENAGATWLPFEHLADIKANESASGGKISTEVIWHGGAQC